MENTPSVAIRRRREVRASLQFRFQVFHVRMGKAQSFGFAQPDAVDHAGMVERIADHSVSIIEQDLEEASVGIEARTVEDGVLGAQKGTDRAFEGFVGFLRSANEAHRGHAIAVSPKPAGGCLDDARMIGQTQVVVGTEVQDSSLCAPEFPPAAD